MQPAQALQLREWGGAALLLLLLLLLVLLLLVLRGPCLR